MSFPRELKRYSPVSVLILILVWSLTQFAGLFSPQLMDDVDGIHSEAAREMALRHDYVTLYVDGIRYLDKPPLPYWLGALSVHIFGPHDWAIRLTLALSVLALTLYIYWFGIRCFGERAGLYSGCVFATAIGPYIFTRFFIPDVIVALWMTVAADLILRLRESAEAEGGARPLQTIAFALVCAGAVLTKGLIGVVFPVGLLLLYFALIRKLNLLFRLRIVLGTVIFCLAALPWHILAAIRNPASGASRGWFWFYFVNEQINRYLNQRIPRDYDKVPLLTFWALLIVWIMPWGVFLPGVVREWWGTRQPGQERGARALLAVWIILVVGFFSFSTRQEYYTLPAVPALALLIGSYLGVEEQRNLLAPRWPKLCALILFASGTMAAIVFAYFAIVSKTPSPGMELYQALQRHPSDYTLSFGHLFDLTTTAFGFFRVPLAGMAISLFFTTGLFYWLRSRRRVHSANLVLTFGMCAVLSCIHLGLQIFYPILGSGPLAEAINRQLKPSDLIVLDGEYSNGSSINFYTRHPVLMLNGRVNNLWYGSLFADAPHRFEDNASFGQLWRGQQRVFFVTHDEGRTKAWRRENGGFLLASSSGKFVLSNQPDHP